MHTENSLSNGLETGKDVEMDTDASLLNNANSEQLRLLVISVFSLDAMRDDCLEAYADAILALDTLNFGISLKAVQSNINEIIGNIILASSSVSQEAHVNADSIGSHLGFEELNTIQTSKTHTAVQFLLCAASKCNREARQENKTIDEKTLLTILENCIYSNFCSTLRGHYEPLISAKDAKFSFLKRLYDDTITESTLIKLISYADDSQLSDSSALSDIFNPILDILRVSMSAQHMEITTNDPSMYLVFRLLIRLLSVKISSRRPICDLLSARADFHHKPITDTHQGREIALLSYLGPFFCFGIVADERKPITKAFEGCHNELNRDSVLIEMKQYQQRVSTVRTFLHQIVHNLVANVSTRKVTLKWIADLIDKNKKRAQMHPDTTTLAPNHFMVNLMFVMYELSAKIELDKVNPYYPFKSKALVDYSEDTRLKLNLQAAKEFQKKIDDDGEEKFTTECFFLTIACQQLVLEPINNMIDEFNRYISEIKNKLESIRTNMASLQSSNKSELDVKLKRNEMKLKVYSQIRMIFKCQVKDPYLISNAMDFAKKQLSLLLQAIDKNGDFSGTSNQFSFPTEAPELFAAYPEHYLNDVLHLLVFAMQNMPEVIQERRNDWPGQLLCLFTNQKLFNNPFLVSQLVEVMTSTTPGYIPSVPSLWFNMISLPIAKEKLLPSLIKFYADIEDGGDFYEKFKVRRNIQIIFSQLSQDYIYKAKFMDMARNCGPEFVRFVNMIINDATWCIDESLAGLKQMHDVEKVMAKVDEWNNLSQDERERQIGIHEEAKRKVKGWLNYALETLGMMVSLTADSPQPFEASVLGERLAAMLNHNLAQLCGNKCQELKVKDAVKNYGWEPRKFVSTLVDIYLNLHNAQFVKYIAYDERTYTPAVMKDVILRMKQSNIVSNSQIERFVRLAEDVELEYNAKAEMEEDLDDAPEEYKDPIMDAIMKDPVKLPSGHIMERAVIERHLLSTPNNPFNRAPLTVGELLPQPELKAEIEAWIADKRNKK